MSAPPGEQGAPLSAYRLLGLLTLANVLNFYDRTVPAVVIEPIKREFALDDSQIGLISSAFVVVYALAGVALGRLADRGSRRKVMAVGLMIWSLFTALSGGAWSFASILIFRLGVGIGEASYAPSANALIFDSFPTHHRARAVSIFQLGLPIGLLLAYLTVGPLVELTGSWRWPFVIAAVPGFVVAVLFWRLPGPGHHMREDRPAPTHPFWHLISLPTVRWLMLAGIGTQIASYAGATFLVPLMQRWFGMPLTRASLGAGLVLGVGGLIAFPIAGWVADRAAARSLRARLVVGALGMTLAAPLSYLSLSQPPHRPGAFLALLALGWFCSAFLGVAAMSALSDVIAPQVRATGVALYLAAMYLFGGSIGPLLTGYLSDWFTSRATRPGQPIPPGAVPDAYGLHQALLWLVPISFTLAAVAAWLATRTIQRDHDREAAAYGDPDDANPAFAP